MKKLLLILSVLFLCFFSCKTTDSIENAENIENAEINEVQEENIVDSDSTKNKDSEVIPENLTEEINNQIPEENFKIEESNQEETINEEIKDTAKTGLLPQEEIGPRPERVYKNRPVLRPKQKTDEEKVITEIKESSIKDQEDVIILEETIANDVTISENLETNTENIVTEEPQVSILDNEEQIEVNQPIENEIINDEISPKNLDEEKIVNKQDNTDENTKTSNISNDNRKEQESIPKDDQQTIVTNDQIQNENDTVQESQIEIEPEIEPELPVFVQIPSRSVQLLNGQYLQVEYPGNGWIYIGEENNTTNMRYFGKKISENKLIFTLKSQKEGECILHFYRLDTLTNKYIDDLLQVQILPTENKSSEIVIAPEYKYPEITYVQVEENEVIEDIEESTYDEEIGDLDATIPMEVTENVIDSSFEPEVQIIEDNESIDTQNLTADELLSLANEAYDNKEYEQSLSYLDSFFDIATLQIDEALFLQGKVYEANSNIKDIKKARESYQEIIDSYKQSPLWSNANKRIIYLDRIYFQIR